MMRRIGLLCVAALAFGCGDDDGTTTDAGMTDMGMDTSRPDAGDDAGRPDAGDDAGMIGCTTGCVVVEVATGSDATCARRENGSVWCWGGNLYGQLGDNRMRHMACGLGVEPPDCSNEPVKVRGLEATAIFMAGPGACALEMDGTLVCWGLTDTPEMGAMSRERRFQPEPVESFPEFSAVIKGASNTCVILGSDGSVMCQGENESGEIGDGTTERRREPVAAAMGLTNVLQMEISSAGSFACARTATSVHCWGDNRGGQLGDGLLEHEQVCSPGINAHDCHRVPVEVLLDDPADQVVVGANHACALIGTAVWCWGGNSAGQVGLEFAMGTVPTPVQVEGIEAVAIAAGGSTTCATLTDGSVRCWGRNDEGQLGDGADIDSHGMCTLNSRSVDCTFMPVTVAGDRPYNGLSMGPNNVCALSDGVPYCWGWNDKLQLGPNGATDRTRSAVPLEVVIP